MSVKKWPHICAECGEPFLGIKTAKFCSRRCSSVAAGDAFAKKQAIKAAEKADARRRNPFMAEREMRLARMAARDAAYAAAFPSCASGSVRGRVASGVAHGIHVCVSGEIVARVIAR